MRKALSIVLFLVLALSTVVGLARDEQRLSFAVDREVFETLGWEYLTSVDIVVGTERPEGVDLPELNGDTPLFGRWVTPRAREGFLPLALDRSEGSEQYDLLYIDTNDDGSLADETPIRPLAVNSTDRDRYDVEFDMVEVNFDTDGGQAPYRFRLDVFIEPNHRRVRIMNGGYSQGIVDIGGEKYRCILIDYNLNGTFDDAGSDFMQVDRILIGRPDSDELRMFIVGKYIELGGEYFRPIVACDGTWIIFEPAEDAVTGVVRVHEDIDLLVMGGEAGMFHLRPATGVTRLPIGEYFPYVWKAEKTDEQGRTWNLLGHSHRYAVHVTADEETVLDIGLPLVGKLIAEEIEPGFYSFSQHLTGRQGERMEIYCDGSARWPAPQVHIRSSNGSYDRTFAMEYGKNETCSLLWQIPADAVDPFVATVVYEMPFPIVAEGKSFERAAVGDVSYRKYRLMIGLVVIVLVIAGSKVVRTVKNKH